MPSSRLRYLKGVLDHHRLFDIVSHRVYNFVVAGQKNKSVKHLLLLREEFGVFFIHLFVYESFKSVFSFSVGE